MESNILLESGTNELEVLEFMVGTQSFGINIAKVTEIMNYQPMVPVPDSHPAFEGVFTPRDKVISVINLHTILHKESPDPEHDLLIICHFNGKDAWDYVSAHKELGGNILNEISCVISDIEMPKMDGHHLTKQIKDDPVLKSIPVYLFSSLINDQMRIKGESVGADGQFSKPQIGQLIQYLNEHI